jgi:hypothetical protein
MLAVAYAVVLTATYTVLFTAAYAVVLTVIYTMIFDNFEYRAVKKRST